jgi:hypothetical protein
MALEIVRLLVSFSVYSNILTTVVVAGRTIMQSIINALERITYDGDPLQFLVESTTYQPFISLFKQTEMINSDPTIKGIRACSNKCVCILNN